MTEEKLMNQGAIVLDKQGPHGLIEPVPIRECGIGLNSEHPSNPFDDEGTELRRNHYGETIIWLHSKPDFDKIEVEEKTTKTRDEQIRGSNSDNNPETTFGRHMCA